MDKIEEAVEKITCQGNLQPAEEIYRIAENEGIILSSTQKLYLARAGAHL